MSRRGLLRAEQGGPRPALAGIVLAALVLAFWSTGALLPGDALPSYATSARQITGMALMLTLLPAYVLAAWSVGQRRSLDLIEQLRPLAGDPADADRAAEIVRGPLRPSSWAWGTAIGVTFGLLNTEPVKALTRSNTPAIDGSISLGQMFMWWLFGLLIVDRLRTARAFRKLGEGIRFDLFRLDAVRPLARSGIIDVVIVAGALLLSPLQSLDARLRVENY